MSNQNIKVQKLVSLPGKKALFVILEDSSNPGTIELNGVKMLKLQFEQRYRGYKILSSKLVSD